MMLKINYNCDLKNKLHTFILKQTSPITTSATISKRPSSFTNFSNTFARLTCCN